jgi:DNA-binding winged helix-turn-helix (wHTH) protein/Tol biopolymer transport system component
MPVRDPDQSASVAFHPSAARRALLFGPFRFDVVDKTLSREGQEIRLPPRALQILDYLLERPNRIVGKQELLDLVWKDAFVGESSLTEAIGVLRQALGDSASGAEYIQTVHRRGYRFIAPIRVDAQSSPLSVPSLVPVPEAPARPVPESVATPASAVPQRIDTRSWSGVIVLAAVAVAIAGAAVWLALRPDPAPETTRATITLPLAQAPAPGLTAQPVAALSPDGRRIAYVAGAPGSYRLFLREIDQFEAVPVPGTDGAHGPFFSPDGKSLGFFLQYRLMVMSLPAGQPIDLAAADSGHGGWWHTDGTITFATGSGEGVYRVSSTGGERRPVKVTGVDGATLRHPMLTADGRTMLATVWKFNVRLSEVVAIDLSSGASRKIARGVHPRLLDDGRVIYLRDGDLVAAPLDGSGPEATLISGVMTGVTAAGQYSLAANGTLLYLPDAPQRQLRAMVRISPDGQESPLAFEPRAFQNVSISPDGRRVAVTIYEKGASDLWIGDIERGILQRMTSEGGSVDPVWSADGSTLYFSWIRGESPNVYRVPADGSAPPELHSSVASLGPSSMTRDGVIFATRHTAGGGLDITTIAPDGTAKDWLATSASEAGPRVSPDEKFVVFRSGRSGRAEIYVRPISGEGPEQQISQTGGLRPDWSADGRAIFFAGLNRTIHRVEWRDGVAGRSTQIYASPALLFSRAGAGGIIGLKAIEEERPLTTLNLVVGWTREVSRVR